MQKGIDLQQVRTQKKRSLCEMCHIILMRSWKLPNRVHITQQTTPRYGRRGSCAVTVFSEIFHVSLVVTAQCQSKFTFVVR